MELSRFGGAAGSIVRGFLHPRTLPTLVAVLAPGSLLVLVAVALADLLALSSAGLGVLVLLALGPLAGRFALAAREGRPEAGFLASHQERGVLLCFVGRFTTLTLAWAAPAAAVAGALSVAAVAPSDPARVVVGGGVLVLTTLVLVIASCTSSLVEAWSPAPWRWVLATRRDDLVSLLAALVGGLGLLGLALAPCVLVLDLVAGAPGTARVAAALVGAAALPVLLGRLAGTFVVASEPVATSATAGDAAEPSTPMPPAFARALALADDAGDGMALPGKLRALEARARVDLDDAIADAERIVRTEPANLGAAAALFRLYRRGGRMRDARRAASAAIERALAAGMHGFAAEVFHGFADDRETLALAAPVLDRLGWVLVQRGELDGAAWCFESLALADGDAGAVRSGLLAVAEAAVRGGDETFARALYRSFLDRFPDAPEAAHARAAAERLTESALTA